MSSKALLPVADAKQVTACLWAMSKGRRWAWVGVFLLFLLESMTSLIVPLVIGRIVDDLVAQQTGAASGTLTLKIVLLVIAAAGAGLCTWLGGVSLAWVAETLIAELREDFVAAALKLRRSTLEGAGAGDVITRASDDISEVSDILPEVLPKLFVSVFTLILISATMTVLDWRFFLAFLIIVPFYVITIRWYRRTAPQVYRQQRAVESVRGQHILGTIENLDTVAAHRLGDQQLNLIAGSSWDKVRWAMRTRIVQNRMFGRLNFAQAVGLITVLVVGVWLASKGQATAGMVTSAALLFQRVILPIQQMMIVMDELQAAISSLSRLVGVIEHRDVEDKTESAQGPGNGSVVNLEGVGFGYSPEANVLEDVDLVIDKGEKVAVVGATGSGKSTLASLIAGIYHPHKGSIGRAIPTSEIAFLSQESHVFIGTVRSNLLLADPTATEEQVLNALRVVGADQWVAGLPDGLDTEVGHGHMQLDPAHAQHLALARVVLLQPQLAILDEATAEADSADAELLDQASLNAIGSGAALIIAHRLSQASRADRIIMMKRGRIVENGTHEELLGSGGEYAILWNAWTVGSRR
ncbi:multidrug ABC transporter ATPase/permease [Corynebacterium suranareeae]|uniref:Multidrug ABC transporter ATPase/permease n=1 Tax=Corynebacterium suranareeae TaxID=2506452 RepID=A0A169RQG1_9CORY|nr:ABC transporter ATP-binding protein [Corynebacterium suranareeae]BAU94902.1 multidrug ABC transporter ATPase/permease [Corynebacterium suranareeae]